MKHKRTITAIVILLLAIAAISWWVLGRGARPNILLITLDTTRADFLGCYGHASVRTPALDAFAAEGVRFTRAYCNVPLTLPSHATIMTGLYPPEHGSRVNGINAISKAVPTLAETLAARGYDTSAFVAAVVLDEQFGLARGFNVYDGYDVHGEIDPRDEMALIRYRRGDKVADAALAWLKGRERKPFFCWIHFFDPHRPYYLDEPLDPPHPIRAYEREIAFMDRQVARLLDVLGDQGLLKTTVVVAMGDHGEALGEHGEDEHGLLLYDEVMHVPLIVRLPGARAGGRVSDATVSTVDLVPTLLDLVHAKAPAGASGRSFVPALLGKPYAEAPVFFETEFPSSEYGWSPLQGILHGNMKYIRAPREELYDLSADPAETNSLAAHEAAGLDELRDLLAEMEEAMTVRTGAGVELDETARLALASLGYVGGGDDPGAEQAGALRDPKDAIWMRTEFMDAQEDMRQGRLEQAEKRLTRLLAESPESIAFHYKLGQLLFGQERFENARDVFAAMAERFPDNYAPHYDLGKALIKLKEFDGAIAELGLALQLDDQQVEVHNNLGLACLYKGDAHAAINAFQASIAVDPRQVDPHSNMGHVLLQAGRTEEAIEAFKEALAVDPNAFGPRYNLGLALLQSGRNREAAVELRRAVQLRPDFAPAREKLQLAVDRATPTADGRPDGE